MGRELLEQGQQEGFLRFSTNSFTLLSRSLLQTNVSFARLMLSQSSPQTNVSFAHLCPAPVPRACARAGFGLNRNTFHVACSMLGKPFK